MEGVASSIGDTVSVNDGGKCRSEWLTKTLFTGFLIFLRVKATWHTCHMLGRLSGSGSSIYPEGRMNNT